MEVDQRKVCFVVMGFGKKTDYESGRTLDLDATYESIIAPAVTDRGLRCVRADEICHSGLIDTKMYEMLLHADLVIADISTGNVNAVYELGVRHALRPRSTIIMKESDGRLYFDLNHVSTLQYKHLGDDIGAREAINARGKLSKLIEEVMATVNADSPVYTFLPTLQQPRLTSEQFARMVDQAEDTHDRLGDLIKSATQAASASKHEDAARLFAAADRIKPHDSYIVQQLALSTYKSKKPNELAALTEGLRLINELNPEVSNDPETLGITGAILKRLWLLTRDRTQLDGAIRSYGRGYEIRRDYYNGENYALCMDFRSATQTEKNEALYDRMSARKIRESVITICMAILDSPSANERSDKLWVFASLANCSYALKLDSQGDRYQDAFFALNPSDWQRATYNAGKAVAMNEAARG